jgi:AbrB family looped-hinge helix DNA binding protein
MKLTSKGQVTIPQHIRRFLGIAPHSEVDFVIQDGKVVLSKADSQDNTPDKNDPFRNIRGLLKDKFTTEEIMRQTRGE